MSNHRIFISYRRHETIAHARAVYERLRAELRADYGVDAVFIDLEGLALGVDFVEELERLLGQCSVMLALIGPQWLDTRDTKGRRRLDDPDDFVRLELATALARTDVRVVPVLIDGTQMPDRDELPADLHPLRRRNAHTLRFASFDADMPPLVMALRRILGQPAAFVTAVAALPSAAVVPSASYPSTAATVLATAAVVPAALPTDVVTSAQPFGFADVQTDRFGCFSDLRVKTIVQRLRWIEPREFWMGSPDDEPGRDKNEGPRHRVRLTEGFWLADTACTQALWLAVMGGKNPSKFSDDPNRPVERVSWDDVQTFLQRLQPLLPAGCEAVLPSEAQWEYACRAGTETPFSFGATINPEQVNYDGNYPYAGGKKGQYREKTVPVKSLPANAWGLYEMHGNVWEWCADGVAQEGNWGDKDPAKHPQLRAYPQQREGEILENPIQVQGQGPSAPRVMRGGSWISGAMNCRSASRFARVLGLRLVNLGFRFALRSSSPVK